MKANEILFHAAIGGTVGVGLAAFELVVRQWLHVSLERGVNWTWLWALISVFFVVFTGIACLEVVLNWMPMPVENVGYVGGRWVDAMKDGDGNIIGGSVIEISTKKGRGFELHGTSYTYRAGQVKEWGTFDGWGSVLSRQGLCYYYEGFQGQDTRSKVQNVIDDGLAYYRFSRAVGDKARKYFHGKFYSFAEGAAFHVDGKNVVRGEKGNFKKDGGLQLLLEWLKEQEGSGGGSTSPASGATPQRTGNVLAPETPFVEPTGSTSADEAKST